MTIFYNGTMMAHSPQSGSALLMSMIAAVDKFNRDGRPASRASLGNE
jgi:hypothetical protein